MTPCIVCRIDFQNQYGNGTCTICLARKFARSDSRIAAALADFEALEPWDQCSDRGRYVQQVVPVVDRLVDLVCRRVAN